MAKSWHEGWVLGAWSIGVLEDGGLVEILPFCG